MDPSNKPQTFYYGGLGAGASLFSLRLPKIGKIELNAFGRGATGNLAPLPWWNMGKLFMTSNFRGAELTRQDIKGGCLFVEVNVGVIQGISATGMLLGYDQAKLLAFTSTLMMYSVDILMQMNNAGLAPKAFLAMGGRNVGLQGGASSAGYFGLVE